MHKVFLDASPPSLVPSPGGSLLKWNESLILDKQTFTPPLQILMSLTLDDVINSPVCDRSQV